MFGNKPDPSIRRQLLLWLALSLGCLWLSSSAVVFLYADSASDAIYDQQLLDSADSVVARVQMRNGKAYVHLPESTRSILEHESKDSFYFQLTKKNALLPGSPSLINDRLVTPGDNRPIFKDATINGKPVRTAVLWISAPDTKEKLLLEVAETLNSRNQLRDRILLNILVAQIVVILFGSIAVSFGVSRGLLPLQTVQDAIAERSSSDLRPVSQSGVPVEILPLVKAINELLDRLRLEIDSQKRFVANAAHQIRTPVAGLKTYVGFARRLADSTELQEVLEQVDIGTDRLTHLTNRLLSLARAEPNNKRNENRAVIDLNVIATTALSALVPKAISKDIELTFDAAPVPALVFGDPEGLEELIINIVENAIVYTQQGGHVGVRLVNQDGVILTVEDNGPGIPLSEREQVFDRFYRIMGTEQSGSGLGLSIVKEIALAHAADVSIGSGHLGEGTLVTVDIPAAGSKT